MQKLVGMGDLEFYPNIGVVHKFDDEESIRTLERIQRSVIAGYFRLTGYKTGNLKSFLSYKFLFLIINKKLDCMFD